MKIILGLFVFLLAAAPIAQAAAPGGSDMCGLGWEITKKKSFLATSTRSTTNAFVPPTFGMTTGTIGCDKHSLAKREEAGVIFVSSNQDNLFMEMAAGQGEHLEALARELGCSNHGVANFGPAMQKSLPVLMNTKNSVELYKGIEKTAQNLPGCSA